MQSVRAQSQYPAAQVVQTGASAASANAVSSGHAAENPYGIQAVWAQGDLVAKTTLLILVMMSIQRALSAVQSRMQSGLAVLATVESTAPFVGLFGTVWGIYNALVTIGLSGQASIDKVAGPVGEALIMTAIGLAVAVPAVLGYNWLVRRNKSAMEGVQSFASELHSVLLATARK